MRQNFLIDHHFDHSPEVMWPLTFDSPRAIEATGFPRHGQGAKRPVFDKFVEIMRPKDAGISTTTKTEVMFR